MTTDTTNDVVALLPTHLRARDEESGGLLQALLGAVAGELAVVESDVDSLYDAWFVETCPEWVVPYLADLVGLAELPPDLGTGAGGAPATRRALVANTVAYRRRKGTVGVLEQVARDVTGWPAVAVEFYRLLAASTHLNHVRLDRPATASLRAAEGVEHARTAEARRIASGRGRYGIGHIGVFLYGTQVFAVDRSQARRSGAGYTVDPLGRPAPLFAVPVAEEDIEQRATEENLPVPLRPRRLLELLAAARDGTLPADELPVAVWVGTEPDPVPPALLRVCGLEDLVPGEDGVQVMVDAVRGRLTVYREGVVHHPVRVFARYAYGATAAVGAGTYERSVTSDAVLAADPYSGVPETVGQVSVPEEAATVADALARAEQAWAATPGTFLCAVEDSATYPDELSVAIPAACRLVLTAGTVADRSGARPHLLGDLTVTGGPGSSVVLDGLVLEGDVRVAPGHLGSLAVSQCTVAGRVLVPPDTAGPNGELQVSVVRSQLAGVEVAPTVPALAATDSVLDAAMPTGLPRTRARRDAMRASPDPPAVRGDGAHLTLEGCTVRGRVEVRTLDATSCVLDGRVTVEHRQVGCVRFSYVRTSVGSVSRIPRQYRCVPPDPALVPVYESDQPGAPGWLALAASCPAEIAEGGEFDAEMGVHHHLRRPVRRAAALRQLRPYLPAGLEIGMFGS